MDGETIVVRECLDVAADESVLVVSDDGSAPVARRIAAAAAEVADTRHLSTEVGDHGSEPDSNVTEAMKRADVIVAVTGGSLTHTDAMRAALFEHDARAASMPGVTESMLDDAVAADYDGIEATLERLHPTLESASEARVTAPGGTDVTLSVDEYRWIPESGRCHEPGRLTNLPAGEVATGIGDATGTVVVDGSMAGLDSLDEPVRICAEDGRAVEISDPRLAETVAEAGPCGRNFAEFGIGLNPAAELVGNPLQDEKVGGTVHFALGDDSGLGGDTTCEIHLDGVVVDPTVTVDGERLELP